MRYPRHSKILELVSIHNIETQEELAKLLVDNGFKVTQATVSRDIKELKLIKVLGPDGKYKYASNKVADSPSSERYLNLIKDMVLSAASSENIVVIKTLNGCANAACEAIDSLHLEGVLGTIAGDNTIFVVTTASDKSPLLVKFINDQIKSR
ncbi:MAG: arginine repressor [Firmicutes bacterium]|nr:arginine repressor [Clostridiales bacterium]MBQ4340561.1 arginine repressor [Bacillota bacterium]